MRTDWPTDVISLKRSAGGLWRREPDGSISILCNQLRGKRGGLLLALQTRNGASGIPTSPYGLMLILVPTASCFAANEGIAVNGTFQPCFKMKSSDLAEPWLLTMSQRGTVLSARVLSPGPY